MAKSNEIAQINEINKGLTDLNSTLNITATNYLTLVKTISDGSQSIKDNAISFDSLAKAQKQTTDSGKQLDTLGKQLAASEAKLKQVEDSRLQTIMKNSLETQKATKAIKDKIIAEQAAEGSLVRMRQKLSELTAAYDKSGTRTTAAAKEINTLSREIGKAEAATNRHQRGIGGYADQLGKLPGPIGQTATAASGLGKQLWALVANPIVAVIAGIVLVVTALFKAFKSTDDGAVAFSGALKAVKNVVDVLVDRLWSFFKLLGSIITFDFKGMKKNAVDAFGGIGDAIKDAAQAGWNYAKVMDDIDDREVAAANRMARLRVEIETLKNQAAAATGKKKLDLLQQAMDKEVELNGIEKGFLTERNNADVANLASKIQNNKLTQEQKEAQLKQWLAVDDKELESLKKKDAAFVNFVNLNETEFQKLQKSKADEALKDAELQMDSRRMQKGIASEKQAEIKAGQDAAKEAADEVAKQAKIVSDSLEKQQKLKQDISLLNIKDDNERAKQSLAFDRDDQLRNAKNAEEKLLIWEKYYASLEVLIDKQAEDDEEKAKKKNDDQKKWYKDYEDWYLDQLDKQADADKKAADKIKERKEDEKELAKELAFEAGNAIFEFGSMMRDKELNELEIERNKKLSNKKLTEAQKLKIDEEYDKKAAAIKTKQAKSDKLQALFNIALNTAVASMATLSKTPLPAGAVLLALTIALGAIQAGLVLAQPIPKYAKGTKDAALSGIFGEAGRELMFTRSGDVALAEKPTYFEGSKFKGAQIFSNPETERMLRYSEISGNQMKDDRILAGLKGVEKAILGKPVAIFDKENRIIGQGTSKSQTIYLNRLTRNN